MKNSNPRLAVLPQAATAVTDADSAKPAATEEQPTVTNRRKLTPEEQKSLDGYESTIEQGLGSFVDIGKALKAINDDGFYKASYDEFDEYCKERWHMSKKYAYRLMKAADFVGKLKATAGKNAITRFPDNESQVRPIVENLDGRMWVSTWRQVLTEVGDEIITAAKVAKVVREKLGDNAPATPASNKAAQQKETPNDPLPKIKELVKEALAKTDGFSTEDYKQLLDRIWAELEPELEAA